MNGALRRNIFITVAGLAVAGVLVFAFWPRPVPVDLVEVETGTMRVTVDGEGRTRVRDLYIVSAPIAGRVMRTPLERGDAVVAGETVLTTMEETTPGFLDIRSRSQMEAEVRAAEAGLSLAQSELNRDQAELTFARRELARAQTLTERGTAPQRTLDLARRDVETAEARVQTSQAAVRMRESQLETARAALIEPGEETDRAGLTARCCIPIHTPASGQVLAIMQESETVVQPGTALFEIGDPRDLEIIVDLPSNEAVRIGPGAEVLIEAWGGTDSLIGTVRRVEPTGFTKVSALGIEEQRVNVVIDFTDPPRPPERLGHGFRVFTRTVAYEAEDVLRVPVGALVRDGGRWAVFTVEDDRARLKTIDLGPMDGHHAEVRGGLDAGDTIILYPSDQVGPGVRVAPRG